MFAKIKKIVLCALIAATSISCSQKESLPYWGMTEMYNSFLWRSYKPIIMTRTIDLVWNEDAQKDGAEVLFEVIVINGDGKCCPSKDIKVYKNSEICTDNRVSVSPTETELMLGIEFTNKAADDTYTFGLKVVDAGNLNYIQEEKVSHTQTMVAQQFSAQKKTVMNPLAKGLLTGLIVIVALLLLWTVLLCPHIFERFKVRSVHCEYPDDEKIIPLRGYLKVVLTAKKQQQGFFEKFFVGKTFYSQNDFWNDADLVIVPRNKKSIRLQKVPDCYSISDTILVMGEGESITITNTRKQKAVFTF